MKKQSGFALLESLLVILILAVIGFGGYIVWNKHKNKNSSVSQPTNHIVPNVIPATSGSCSNGGSNQLCGVDQTKYLVIKEWGIKIPLSSTISSAVYSSGQYSTGNSSATGGSAKLGLVSLGSDCGDSSDAPLGQYVEFTQADVNEEDASHATTSPTLHDLAKSAVTLGKGYMFAYAAPQQSCDSDINSLNSATAAFEQALKGIKSVD